MYFEDMELYSWDFNGEDILVLCCTVAQETRVTKTPPKNTIAKLILVSFLKIEIFLNMISSLPCSCFQIGSKKMAINHSRSSSPHSNDTIPSRSYNIPS